MIGIKTPMMIYLFEIPDYRLEAARPLRGFRYFYDSLSKKFLKFNFPYVVKSAYKIIASSDFTKKDLISKYQVPENKIDVVFSAQEKSFNPASSQQKILEIREKISRGFPYFLHFATSDPRDNTECVIKAYELAKRDLSGDYKMMIVGSNPDSNEVLRKDVGIAPLVEQIGKIVKVKDRIIKNAPLTGEKSILIVDDEERIRNLLKEFFQAKGYRIFEAENGEDALKITQSESPSAVLLDMHMPGMDGLATLKKLREANAGLGVVMATGDQDDGKVKKALELGAYGYVLKPFDFLYLDLVVMSKLAIAGNN